MRLKEYFKESAKEFKDVRKLVFAGLMVAVSVVLQLFSIPIIGNTLQIQFSFIASALAGAVCGPFLSLLRGFVSDLVGFAIHPTGAFYWGYTLSAGLGATIYSLFFWKRKITLPKIFLSKLTVNVIVNAVFGSIWNMQLYGKNPYLVYFGYAFSKNLLLLPFEFFVLVLMFRSLLPILAKMRYYDGICAESLNFDKKNLVIICACCVGVIVTFFLAYYFAPTLYPMLKNVVKALFT